MVKSASLMLLVISSWLLAAAPARAQTFQPFTNAAFSRDQPYRKTQEKPFWINRADCLADDVLHFQMKVNSPTDDNLEVWVGNADCRTRAQRLNDDAGCWQVYEERAEDDSFTVHVRVQDVAARRPASGYRARGTIESCDVEWSSSLSFYFMYVNDTDDVISSIVWSETGVDLKGPSPPSNVEAGTAESSLVAKWTASKSTDLFGYRVYCAPRQDVVDPGIENGDAGPTLAAPDAGADSGSPELPTPSEQQASPDGATNPEVEPTTIECSAPGLIAGELPGPDLPVCGETSSSSATRAFARGLTNGEEYALAVAAMDDLGNAGTLSNVACGIPAPVDEFYEDYKRFGGGGGGGICSVSPRGTSGQTSPLGSTTLLAWLGLAGAAAWFRLRRGT